MKAIGFVGTAKNTGKTTTALHMLELANAAGMRTALTSIGYDGENTDHVTGLPKPRYFAAPGNTIATALPCLEIGSAKTCIQHSTGLKTILGEIVIATVTEPGTVVLAGPNRRVDVKILLDQLRSFDIDLIYIDGALNRLAAISAADGMVLSTGAAYDERIDIIASHAAAIESLFHFPRFDRAQDASQETVTITKVRGNNIVLDSSSILDESTLRQLSDCLNTSDVSRVWIPGVFSPQLFLNLIESNYQRMSKVDFVFASPVSLLAAGSPTIWSKCFALLMDMGSRVYYKTPLPLYFMTVNPFYPKYLQKTASYTAAYVDNNTLLSTVRSKIQKTPVIDILQPPHPDLLTQCGIN